ncbi:hypothetical protein LCM17_13060 [Cereibacter sphaeroides]|nr:hypothetical protein [Cereibacter sphaeroides]
MSDAPQTPAPARDATRPGDPTLLRAVRLHLIVRDDGVRLSAEERFDAWGLLLADRRRRLAEAAPTPKDAA